MQVTTSPVWSDRDGLTPAIYAEIFIRAGKEITRRGYDPDGENYGGTQGISLRTALALAVSAWIHNTSDDMARRINPADLAEEAEVRLTGLAYALGICRRRTHIDDLADRLAAWELAHDWNTGAAPGEENALHLLDAAQRMMAHV